MVELYLVEQKDHYFTKDLWKELLDLVPDQKMMKMNDLFLMVILCFYMRDELFIFQISLSFSFLKKVKMLQNKLLKNYTNYHQKKKKKNQKMKKMMMMSPNLNYYHFHVHLHQKNHFSNLCPIYWWFSQFYVWFIWLFFILCFILISLLLHLPIISNIQMRW